MSLQIKWIFSAVACFCLWTGALHAQAPRHVVLLLSGDSEPYLDVVSGIQSTLPAAFPAGKLEVLSLEQAEARQIFSVLTEKDLLVAIGSRATEYALRERHAVPVFPTFITRNSLLSVVAELKATNSASQQRLRRAVVLDQPATRVINLVRLITPQAERLGTVVNGSSPNRLDEFSNAVSGTALQLQVAALFEGSNPIKDLKQVFAASDVFVVIPDTSRFNSNVAKWILFLSYRHRIPVIGYSQKYTDAGAAISLFTDPFQIGQDTGNQLQDVMSLDRPVPPADIMRYPRYFSLSVNGTVLDSLGLQIGDPAELKQRLLQTEKVTPGGNRHE